MNVLILNSSLVTYNFKDKNDTERKMNFNKVTIAFRDDLADDKFVGYNNILSINLDPTSFEITKSIKPNELVKCTLSLKKAEENKFKYTITKIKDILV